MLWGPAKEASVPHVVPEDQLATANSLSLVAAYGTFPLGAGLMALFGRLSTALFDSAWADNIRLDDMGLAFYANALSFLVTGWLILTLNLPKRPRAEKDEARGRRLSLDNPMAELREGWRFAFGNPVARTVNLGLATGLIGGGMLVPLGAIYADEVLGAGKSGLGVLITALGLGVASGVGLITWRQKHLDKARMFTVALTGAGIFLAMAASISQVHASTSMVFCIGICAGGVYVLGFTLLHETVDDELRGRIFSTLYLLVRGCVLLALVVGPLMEDLLDRLSSVLWDRHVEVFGLGVNVPGVRLTLWLAALIILASGAVAAGCTVELAWDEVSYAEVVDNRALLDRYMSHSEALGRPVGPTMVKQVVGSTDMGNISYLMPGIHPMIKTAPEGTAIHTEDFARYAVSEEADRSVVHGAKVMAMTVVDCWTDPSVLAAAHEEFARF